MKLFFKYIKMNFKSELQYKTSFILSFFSQIFIVFSYYFVILALFDKFNNVKGFTLYEVLLTYGIIEFGFSLVDCFARGLDKFDRQIISGNFDRILLRPANIFVQIIANETDFVKISRTLQALIIIIISIVNLNIEWSILKIICLILMILSSIALFFGICILGAAYCFVTIQGLEVRNVFSYGGKHMAQYPMGIFKKGILIFATVVIPYALVNYYPLIYFIGKSNNIIYAFCPAVVFLYLIPCFVIFKKGIKKYSSTGS